MTRQEKIKPIYYIYRPNVEKIMKQLAKRWKREGLDCHFGHIKGIPITRG